MLFTFSCTLIFKATKFLVLTSTVCHSTEWAAKCFDDTIRRNIDQGQLTGAVFVDLRKAFDSIDYDVLLNIISRLSVRHCELQGFKNYLLDRTQVVEIQGVTSAAESVFASVPQGSKLGPLLFILHLNGFPNAVAKCSVLMYADDIVLLFSAPQESTTVATINRELKDHEHWLKVNCLFIYARLFGKSQKLPKVDNFSIFLSGSLIERVTEFKYLGVITLDKRLGWNEHIISLISKAGKRIGLLSRLHRFLTSHSANVIYLLIIRPTLEFCSGV